MMYYRGIAFAVLVFLYYHLLFCLFFVTTQVIEKSHIHRIDESGFIWLRKMG